MKSTSIENLKEQAKSLLSEEAYGVAVNMNIAELHKAYSVAHEKFQDQVAKGYENLITVRMLGGK